MKAATAKAAAYGFRKAGLFPCNWDIFRRYGFAVLDELNKNTESSTHHTNTAPQPGHHMIWVLQQQQNHLACLL
jgi:hypothetical protein